MKFWNWWKWPNAKNWQMSGKLKNFAARSVAFNRPGTSRRSNSAVRAMTIPIAVTVNMATGMMKAAMRHIRPVKSRKSLSNGTKNRRNRTKPTSRLRA